MRTLLRFPCRLAQIYAIHADTYMILTDTYRYLLINSNTYRYIRIHTDTYTGQVLISLGCSIQQIQTDETRYRQIHTRYKLIHTDTTCSDTDRYTLDNYSQYLYVLIIGLVNTVSWMQIHTDAVSYCSIHTKYIPIHTDKVKYTDHQ